MSQARIKQLREYLKDDPEDAFLNYALALELLKMNELEEARTLLEQLRGNRPDYLATYYRLGKLYEDLKMKQAALTIYKDGIELARHAGERHTMAELQSAYQNLLFSEDD
jgi:tetratricopeptide (TPR) repeat protein